MNTTIAAAEIEIHHEQLIIAFIQGAKWWEYHQTGATMWQSDQNLAEETARDMNTLGMREC